MQVVVISGLFYCHCWLFSCVSILWCRSRSCLSFCSVCNNFIGPVLLSRSYIWHWYWLHRCIVSSICHEFDNISLMVSESVMYSTSMVDDALDCILGVLLPIVEIRPCSEACIASSSILLLYVLASCWICYVSLLGCVIVIKNLTVAHPTAWAYVSSQCWLLDAFSSWFPYCALHFYFFAAWKSCLSGSLIACW